MFDHRLMNICPESKKYIIWNIVFQWLELMCNAFMISIIATQIQSVFLKKTIDSSFWIWVLLLVGAIFIRIYTARKATRMSFLASRSIKKRMREMIYQKLLRLGISYRKDVSTAELTQISVEGIEQLESYFGQYVPQFFYAFLAPLTIFVLFGLAGSWKVATILLICVPLIPVAIMIVQKIAKKLLSKYWDQYAQLGSTFLDNLQGMTTLKTYQADAFKNVQMNEESEHFRTITMKVLTMQLNSIIIMDFIAYGGAALGILFVLKYYLSGNLSLASAVFMILLSADYFIPMRKLGSYFHVAMNGMAASDKIFKFLSIEENHTDTIPFSNGDICIKNLFFSYEKDREVLHDISLNIPKGSFVGIIGESGSGKSTIAALLMKKYPVSDYAITINGIDINQIQEESLFHNMTYVGSNCFLMKTSVRENLLPANDEATDEDLWQVLEECSLKQELMEKGGLEMQLLENGSNLSGGQRQRLALARALLHNSSIYIFDEATSNIDMESEKIILEKIQEIAKTKTVLFITHRLMNIVNADRIYCLDHGVIKESGTHDELLCMKGIYNSLWQTQQMLEQYGKKVA